MPFEIREHRIQGVPFRASPFADERPLDARLELVVVHNISLPPGEFGGPYVEHLFTGQLDPGVHPYFAEINGLEVSAHLLIRRDGELTQFVPFDRRAWHAGKSHWRGRERCNDFSIGIELEGTDETPYTDVQYERLADVIVALQMHYSMKQDAITGHCDIAPARKTDPGPAFDWNLLQDHLVARRQHQHGDQPERFANREES